ncbi:SIS domain-containing protein [Sphingomonas sp. BK481]|uniref:SIS domain-containing protein n=1 Tax=Sphingomonas sp. BK481 TaxID=2586981 RepID=UPI0016217713|nr:SIS domain-containing protein [Sphingomonas sp. BK481]MBB3586179.1 glucosamine--fructose-6-phosphate aminotransferase (isomerizing) [Sphingomonas sp. BK481]
MTNAPPAPLAARDPEATLMFSEAAESGAAVARLLAANADAFATLGAKLRAAPPAVVVTCARGSSDHAAVYGKYLIWTKTGIPVAAAAPSVVSLYDAELSAQTTLCIAISQSGRSPDLLATVASMKAGGAHVVALVNDETSPLAAAADTLIALKAGPERSVAATKSYICALAALAALTAEWADDDALRDAVAALPADLERAWALDWSSAIAPLRTATNLFVIARGPGFGIANEAALKMKETCALHAESFSSAEVRHGPMQLVEDGFPLLALATSDAAGDGVRDAAAEFAGRGACVLLADAARDAQAGDATLPALTAHPAIEPVLMIQSFYKLVNALSVARGFDPDAPSHLAKVTRTL